MTSTERYHYGIDIGGSKIELVACDAALDVCHRQRIATPAQDFDAFVAAVAGLVEAADRALGVPDGAAPVPVGLGMPGIVDAASGGQLSSNVPALNGRQVAPALAARLARPVRMGNDCQCFALSEANGGAAQEFDSMFGVILGTGAGGGYCLGGRLVAGYNGLAGEWGHWSIPASLLARHRLPLLDCPCGLRGCLERYVSGSGLAMLYRHVDRQAELRPGCDAPEIAERAGRGEALAQQALAIHLDLLAHGLAGLVLALDPHVFVLGGGLSRLGHLYRDLPAAVARHLFKGARVPPIVPPAFGDAGGARGAALLARQHDRA
ncbi:ROK family protein [Chitinimonas koreensis]|uniref:ROK family protein n=1 Tax=Chitinimonas koreensis TaxID=356302 RepID=UPI000409A8C7|nr:ROK family protein [Chitinimonas koreensis]QNM95714.1 ROK family protein [Chitinimonas koreensis]